MSDVVKKKIIDIDTGQSQKNVQNLTNSFVPLNKQIKELRNQLAQLEEGSEEYNRVARQLADTQQKQIEVSEAAKYSNRDFGQVMSNFTNISLGLVGGLNAVSASMALLGGKSEDMQKALAPLTLVMAAIQGFSSLDKALKSLNGLKTAFLSVGESATASVVGTEALKTSINSIPDKKTIDIDVNSGKATAELASVSAAANGVSNAENNIAKGGKVATISLKGIAKGFKTAASAVRGFIVANPILAAIAAAVAAVAAGIVFLNKKLEENGRIAKEEADILSNVNSQYDEQNIRLNVLVKTAQDNNQTLEERKAAIAELNKIVPNYNAQLNETTGEYTANNEALQTYLDNLKEKLLLEAYEGKIKEYLQKQLELEEEINDIQETGWWRVKARIRSRRQEIAEFDKDIDRLYKKISELSLDKALNPNKVETTNTTNKVVKVLKSIQDALKETRKLANDFWESFYDVRKLGRMVSGADSLTKDFIDNIEKIVKQHNFGDFEDIFAEKFIDYLYKGTKSVYSEMFRNGLFTVEDVLGNPSIFDELENESKEFLKEISEIDKELLNRTGHLTESQRKNFEAQKTELQNKLNEIQNDVEGYRQIMEEVRRFDKENEELYLQTLKRQNAYMLENKQIKIQEKYYEDLSEAKKYAESDRSLALIDAEIASLVEYNNVLAERLMIYESDVKHKKEYAQKMTELDNLIKENQMKMYSKIIESNIAMYNRRLTEAKDYYEALAKEIGIQQKNIENKNILWGMGSPAYNTQYDQQKLLVDRIKNEMDALDREYELKLIKEEEFNHKMIELKKHLVDESAKLDEMRIDNTVSAVNTYLNVFQSVTGSISNLLNEQMSKYKENSEQYKDLQVANGWITTLSGTLSAFMSGVSSGVPAPWNLVLASALATSTFLAGATQIRNIESGNHSNALTSSASNFGNETYETIAYQQQSELLGQVKDTKFYVTEHDISKAQKNVQVRENDSTF